MGGYQHQAPVPRRHAPADAVRRGTQYEGMADVRAYDDSLDLAPSEAAFCFTCHEVRM
ncbi:hypothetical protein [Streptomyces sp. enrichment culture]|uniref:hypothetical protein n=1 Tax=Streptomyces sp. enrichment culture TaxID=1795815 RepID=UPI003F575136